MGKAINYSLLLGNMSWSLKGPFFCWFLGSRSLLAGGVFGDSLGSLADGVLGQLTGQEKPDSGLDLPRSDGASLVVVGQTAGFGRDTLEDVVHERVHDRHGL